MRQTPLLGSVLLVLFATLFTPIPMYAGGNDIANGALRVDGSDVYNAQDYQLYIRADQLPTTNQARNFTTAWLSVNTDSGGNGQGFLQVGLLAQNDGIHWFVETFNNGGVTCQHGGQVYWTLPNNKAGGCRGAVNDIVALNQWVTVELVKYAGLSYWIARVHGNGTADVAQINIADNRPYAATASWEEGYNEASDPYMTSQFVLKNPQYIQSGTWKDWPKSALFQSQSNFISMDTAMCPAHYGVTPNYQNNEWGWFAGTGGQKCAWLFPPVTFDNSPGSSVLYSGSWTHNSSFPKAYKGTVSWTNSSGDYAETLNTPTTNSITRVYTKASNRGNNTITINNGTPPTSSNDNASAPVRWQVSRTWYASSNGTSIRVTSNGGGYTDIDSFVVDIPRVSLGTYDDRHHLFNYIGNWTTGSFSGPYNGTSTYTQNLEDAVTFTFEGNYIDYYYTKAYNRGKAVITIDGIDYGANGIVDQCVPYPNIIWQQVKTFPPTGNLGPGVHTIHIANAGATGCTGSYIDVDALVPHN